MYVTVCIVYISSFLIVPIARYLGVKEKKSIHLDPNDDLEAAFKKHGKTATNNSSVVKVINTSGWRGNTNLVHRLFLTNI
jgi:hypothetical protein